MGLLPLHVALRSRRRRTKSREIAREIEVIA